MSASILTSWALLVWQELEARQLDANSIFSEANLAPDKLYNAVARYPFSNMQQLWKLAHSATEDDFGINTGNRWSPTSFHALGFAWLASGSLGEALYRVSRYGKFLNDGLTYDLIAEQLLYRFRISSIVEKNSASTSTPSSMATDAGITALLKMLRLLMGEQYSPVQIICPHAPNSASLLLEQLARCPVQYGGDSIEFVFDRHDIEKKLVTGNIELSSINEQIMVKHIAQIDSGHLSSQVALSILQLLPTGNVKEEKIAKALCISSRTMQRRLAEEGASFAKILQQTRKTLSEKYISDDSLAISEAAYLLGFSDQANFTRAFKRWHGVSPSQFRRRACA